jgi:hypothetical protein
MARSSELEQASNHHTPTGATAHHDGAHQTRNAQTHADAGAAAVARITDQHANLAPSRVRLEIYPGEWSDQVKYKLIGDIEQMVPREMGHLYVYVDGKLKASYEVAGGQPPGHGFREDDGHTADATPDNKYTLGPAEHHTTPNWTMSAIPWGAPIRKDAAGFVEFSPDGGKRWQMATGPTGAMTAAAMKDLTNVEATVARREKRKPERIAYSPRLEAQLIELIKQTHDGKFPTAWHANEFGNWAFNLTCGGVRTAIFIHSTPEEEKAYSHGGRVPLMNSHGCVHMYPGDVAAMMKAGYLQRGVAVEVKKYGERGPAAPRGAAHKTS